MKLVHIHDQNYSHLNFGSVRVAPTQEPLLSKRKTRISPHNKSDNFSGNSFNTKNYSHNHHENFNRAKTHKEKKKHESFPEKFLSKQKIFQPIDEIFIRGRSLEAKSVKDSTKKGDYKLKKSQSFVIEPREDHKLLSESERKKLHKKKFSINFKSFQRKEIHTKKNGLRNILEKIKMLKTELKSIPKLRSEHFSNDSESLTDSNNAKDNLHGHLNYQEHIFETQESYQQEEKHIFIDEFNNNHEEFLSIEIEESKNDSFSNKNSESPTNFHNKLFPAFEKYHCYSAIVQENKSDFYKEVRDIGIDTSDLDNNYNINNNLTVCETPKQVEKEQKHSISKIETKTNGIKKAIKQNTVNIFIKYSLYKEFKTKSNPAINHKKINEKYREILNDISKLKKFGLTFIIKFTESAKPLVKVGGGYLSIEQFLVYILEKLNKSPNKSPKNSNCEAVAPELIEKLNNYLTEMNAEKLQKAESKKRESFQGRKLFSNDKSPLSGRGNFMKAVVEKESSPLNSPPKHNRKSIHLINDYSINLIAENKV